MAFDFSLASDRAKHVLVMGLCVGILVYFVAHGLFGERGLVTLSHLEFEKTQAQAELSKLTKQRESMEARARLLRPDSLDLDMLDERTRGMLGYTKPNEYVVLFGK
jgi:cell division protein FtsB